MKTIVQREAPVLRQIAADVPEKDFGTLRLKKIIKEMKEALASQDDGVAIAAPQISYGLRIFVISARFLPEKMKVGGDMVFINPVITKLSRTKKEMEEGCLSVRYLYGKVMRSEKATVTAYDENGKRFVTGGSGLIAQIFQHEVDHLNGILFTDKADSVEEVLPESEVVAHTHGKRA